MTPRASRRLVAALLAGAGLVACTPGEQGMPELPRRGVVGRLALTSPTGQAVQLGPVEVHFIAEQRMAPFVEGKIREARAELERSEAARSELKASAERLIEDNTRANQELRKTALAVLQRRLELQRSPPSQPPAIDAQRRLLAEESGAAKRRATEAGQRAVAAQRDYELARQEAARLTASSFFLRGLPSTTLSATTQVDGKFAVELEPGRYAAVVTTLSPEGTTFSWLVWTRVAADAVTRLPLGNDNLHGTDCAQCVISLSKLAAGGGRLAGAR